MGKSNSSPQIPKSPDPVSLYKQFTNAYLGFQPTYLQNEDQFRGSEDPNRIAQQQGLQNQFGPEQYQQMLSAFGQLDPQYAKLHGQLGDQVSNDLALGYKLAPGQEQQVEQGLRGSQAARGNASGASAGIAEAYALGDKGAQMYQQRINNAGSFLGSPSIAQQSGFVPPVSADRSFAYVNPNAGFQGVTLGNQAYANNVAALGANNQNQGNPWMSTIGALGSVAGGALAAFSDERLKTDIERVGTDEKGLGLYTFAYKNPQKYVGRLAQEVQQVDPGAVFKDPASGYLKVTQEYAPVEVS